MEGTRDNRFPGRVVEKGECTPQREFKNREYTFTFFDSDTREPITGNKIEVLLLPDGESPITFFSDSSGRYSMKTDQSKVKMIVSVSAHCKKL